MYKVIIADDELRARRLIQMLVPWQELGLELTAQCEDGDELCVQAKVTAPDIINTDMRMPGVNGARLIQELHEALPGSQIIVVSGFDDFEYMRQALVSKAVDYILKPIEEEALYTALQDAVSELERLAAERKRSRREIFNQYLHSDTPITESESARYLPNAARYAVVTINLFETREAMPQAVRRLMDTVQAESVRCIGSDGIVFRDDGSPNGICVILFCEPEPIMEALSRSLAPVCQEARVEAVLACGQSFPEKRRIKRSYHQAQAAFETYHVFQGGGIVSYDAQVSARVSGMGYQKEGYSYLLKNAQESASVAEYRRCMQMFVESASRMEYLPLGIVRSFVRQFIKSMGKLVLCQTPNITMTGLMSLNTQLLLRLEPEDIRTDLEEFLRRTYVMPSEQNREGYTGRAQELRAYLDKHYREKFTLAELASIFYLNKEYMSKMFRREYGVRISEYVDFLKLEEAKRLLLEGDKTVSEITELLNFYDESHFNKKFKKSVGVSPKDFRK